ncbi:MAG: hypothetical protein ACI4V7_12080 [Succinivibrionaceae bacterium]
MAKENLYPVVLGIGLDEVSLLSIRGDKIQTLSHNCNSSGEWEKIIFDLFNKAKITKNSKVQVVLNGSIYNTVQLPKNELLTVEEMYGVAMYKDLENLVQGKISDFTWDFYDTKTSKNSKPMQTFVLVEKSIVKQLSDIINSVAILNSITINELAVADFLSFYMFDVNSKTSSKAFNNVYEYVNQLSVLLYLEENKDLMVYAVYMGEICYFRSLRGYRELSRSIFAGDVNPIIEKLTTDILRLSDDFFTSQLGLPPMSKLILVLDTDQQGVIADLLGQNFRRIVEIIPTNGVVLPKDNNSYTVCGNDSILNVFRNGGKFLPLYGLINEGVLKSEKN